MIPDANIIETQHTDFRGGTERIEYEWRGGSIVDITDRYLYRAGIYGSLSIGSVVNIGPFRLIVLDYDQPRRAYTFCRTGFKGTVKYSVYRLTKHFDFIYRRLVITAAVWGLAKYEDYSVPTWRDVYFLAWLAKRIKWPQ